jgi:hypothetical protein
MNYLGANMKLIVECSQKLVRLGENLWGKEQELDKAEPLDVPTMTTEFVKEHGLPCPEGFIFKDENGNVINTNKIVLEKKKKEYPKTYEECCKVLHYAYEQGITMRGVTEEEEELFKRLIVLKRCRDAYWKLYGEEMGLGKPWKPNWETLDTKYDIYNYRGVISHNNFTVVDRCVLVFPTEEMRDAFYENFKELIGQCKELL